MLMENIEYKKKVSDHRGMFSPEETELFISTVIRNVMYFKIPRKMEAFTLYTIGRKFRIIILQQVQSELSYELS
jgi:hypothetical protein